MRDDWHFSAILIYAARRGAPLTLFDGARATMKIFDATSLYDIATHIRGPPLAGRRTVAYEGFIYFRVAARH